MKKMIIICSVTIVLTSLVLVSLMQNFALAQSNDSVTMEGYFNIGEKIYPDGKFSYVYKLFVDNGTEKKTAYSLKFAKDDPSSLHQLVGKHVKVKGKINSKPANYAPFPSQNKINVESISESNHTKKNAIVSERSFAAYTVPLDSLAILVKFANLTATEPHTKEYFQSRLYDASDSLNAFWQDASYRSFSMSKVSESLSSTTDGVVNWQTLPKTSSQYLDSDGFFDDLIALQDAINLVDPYVNFNQVEQVILVFNDKFPDSMQPYSFAYFGPVPITTSEGAKSILVVFSPDMGTAFGGFPVGQTYFNGIGVTAHEMGHNFAWNHTPTPGSIASPYDDTWSLMSKAGDFGSNGPVAPITFNRDEEGWIPLADRFTISSGERATFTLDVLNDPSPGPNFLMGKIPFTVTAFGVSIPSGASTNPGCSSTFSCYNPYYALVQSGDTITWTNNDSVPHTVVSGTPGSENAIFNSGNINGGQTFSHTFNSAGVFDYFCVIHPWMTGVVEVLSGSHQDNYYTIEARKDTPTFDETPQDQMGIVMYNVSPTGHPSTLSEPFSEANIVDTTGTGDWDNADLDVGFTYADLTNRIYITSLSQTSTTITVNVQNNPPCSPPALGDWIVVASCTVSSNAAVITGDVIVQNNAVLTIQNNVSLDIDFTQHHLLVKSGSGVLVKSGGKIF